MLGWLDWLRLLGWLRLLESCSGRKDSMLDQVGVLQNSTLRYVIVSDGDSNQILLGDIGENQVLLE